MGAKDEWNRTAPSEDSKYADYYNNPELMNLLPVLYPAAFPKLAELLKTPAAQRARADLVAVLLTGLPSGIIPGFQNNTGKVAVRRPASQHGHPAERQPQPLWSAGQ